MPKESMYCVCLLDGGSGKREEEREERVAYSEEERYAAGCRGFGERTAFGFETQKDGDHHHGEPTAERAPHHGFPAAGAVECECGEERAQEEHEVDDAAEEE